MEVESGGRANRTIRELVGPDSQLYDKLFDERLLN